MTELSKNARIVGFWYLLWSLVGLPSLLYIPRKLYVTGDAATTATNIAAHQTLFQFGIATDLVGSVILIFLVIAFYRLFKDVSPYQAVFLAIIGGVLPAATSFASVATEVATLIMVRGPDYLNVFSETQREALAYFFTRVSFPPVPM
jgi:fluoride ion exporter CrcB/FEX